MLKIIGLILLAAWVAFGQLGNGPLGDGPLGETGGYSDGLPDDVGIDSATGALYGSFSDSGEYDIIVIGFNSSESDTDTVAFDVNQITMYTTTANGAANAPISGGGVAKPYGAYDTLMMIPASGYGGRLAGRAMVLYPGRDTLIVQVLKDSTVASLAYLISVIDSTRRKTTYPGKLFSIYTHGEDGPQGAGVIYFSTNINVPTDSLTVAENWTGGLINDTVPVAAASRWHYVWYRTNAGMISNKDSIRVYHQKGWWQ